VTASFDQLDAWVDAHFDEEVRFLQALIRVPTDTPPGNNAPHAKCTAALLREFGFEAQRYPVPQAEVQAAGLQSITNLVVRRKYGAGKGIDGGKTVMLNAHGDVVPAGEGWTHDPYAGEIENGIIFGRAAAVSKSDFASYTFAVRALEAVAKPSSGSVELLFTYDEEFGGELGVGRLLREGVIKPDLVIGAGFSYQVITAHAGCLQLEVTVHGSMAHAAIPESGVDALQAANGLLTVLYQQNYLNQHVASEVEGMRQPYLNIGTISGGTNTNVVPGRVTFKFDRRMIPEEDPAQVEAGLRQLMSDTVASIPGIRLDVKRILLARALRPLPGNLPLVQALQKHGKEVFGETIPALGTPLYTDMRLFCEAGIPAVMYGAGPRTVLESHAKRADERLDLQDLRRATKVLARTLHELLV
jgi:succinyl-diaminopimelate desuccinylase